MSRSLKKTISLLIMVICVGFMASSTSASISLKSHGRDYYSTYAQGYWEINYCHYQYQVKHILNGKQTLILQPGTPTNVTASSITNEYYALSQKLRVNASNSNYVIVGAEHSEYIRCIGCNRVCGYNYMH